MGVQENILSSEDYSEEDKTNSTSNLMLEKYAIFYNSNFYIGSAVETLDDFKTKYKFLKLELNQFIWLKNDDTDIVKNEFIIYGSIDL